MSQTFKSTRRVEFRDTDMAGIVHFSVFFTYMEEVEHQFLRSLGFGVISEFDGQRVSFPRVNAQCNYLNAIRFEEIIDIELSVIRIGTKSITWQHRFSRDGVAVAEGTITTVCCKFHRDLGEGNRPESVPIPEAISAVLKPFVQSS